MRKRPGGKPGGIRRSSQPRPETAPDAEDGSQRLQKLLAQAGLGSRRACEELILSGRVEVDDQVVTELGTKVDPQQQKIYVDGSPIKQARTVYYMLNKPPGVLSTNRDPSGRQRVIDLLPESSEHVYSVGRLDKSSEGLILLTNDGELAQRLAHPRFSVEKTYEVLVAGTLTREEVEQLKKGVHLADGLARVAGLSIKSRRPQSTLCEMVLREGKNREIRRVLARLGHKVLRLRRIAIGELKLKTLPVGDYRKLNPAEVELLRRSISRRPRPSDDEATSGGEDRPQARKPSSAGKPAQPRKPARSPQERSASAAPSARRSGPGTIIGGEPLPPSEAKPKASGTSRRKRAAAAGRAKGGTTTHSSARPAADARTGAPRQQKPRSGETTSETPRPGKPKGGKPAGGAKGGKSPRAGKPTGGKPAGGKAAAGKAGPPRGGTGKHAQNKKSAGRRPRK